MVVHQAQLFVFGGVINAQKLLNDVWGYDYAQEQWHELESPSNPLLHHVFSADSNLHGMGESETDRLTKTHLYHPPGSPPPPRMRRNPATVKVSRVEIDMTVSKCGKNL